jgi:hypothetical protein
MYYVVNSITPGVPVISSNCTTVKDQHGFTMPVLFDPLNTINGPPWNYPENHHFSVMTLGNQIVYQGSNNGQMLLTLDALLSD